MADQTQHELVAVALLAALKQMDASNPNYWYGPGEIFPVRFYRAEYFAQERDSFTMLRSGTALVERSTNCEWAVTRTFYVLRGVKNDDAEQLPWEVEPGDAAPTPVVVQERLLGDIELALADDTLGDTTDLVDIVGVEYSYDLEPWTMVEVELAVQYTAPKRTVN